MKAQSLSSRSPRRSPRLLARAVAVSSALCLGALAVPAGASTANSGGTPLVSVGGWNTGYTYHLASLKSCEIGDANLAFKNSSGQSVRITAVSLNSNSAATMAVTARLVERNPGSTTGEVAATLAVPVVTGSGISRAAVGSVVKPFSSARHWYFVVLRVRLQSGAAYPWDIRGADINYSAGSHHYVLHLRQHLTLPAAPGCA